MGRGTNQGKSRQGWVARLVQVQLMVSGFGTPVEAPPGDDRWAARLIRAGAVLMGVGGMGLASWLLQRH